MADYGGFSFQHAVCRASHGAVAPRSRPQLLRLSACTGRLSHRNDSAFPRYRISAPLCAVGVVGLFAVLAGRFYCSHLCPFGFLQDMLSRLRKKSLRIPPFSRIRKVRRSRPVGHRPAPHSQGTVLLHALPGRQSRSGHTHHHEGMGYGAFWVRRSLRHGCGHTEHGRLVVLVQDRHTRVRHHARRIRQAPVLSHGVPSGGDTGYIQPFLTPRSSAQGKTRGRQATLQPPHLSRPHHETRRCRFPKLHQVPRMLHSSAGQENRRTGTTGNGVMAIVSGYCPF